MLGECLTSGRRAANHRLRPPPTTLLKFSHTFDPSPRGGVGGFYLGMCFVVIQWAAPATATGPLGKSGREGCPSKNLPFPRDSSGEPPRKFCLLALLQPYNYRSRHPYLKSSLNVHISSETNMFLENCWEAAKWMSKILF